MQQRQHGLGDTKRAEEVRIENRFDHSHICRSRQSIPAQVDTRFVDQDIEAAVITLNELGRGCNGVLRRNIDFNKVNLATSGLLEHLDSLLPAFLVARTQQYCASGSTKIPRDFQTDALIAAGHFNSLSIHPSVVVRKKRSDHGTDIVRHTGAVILATILLTSGLSRTMPPQKSNPFGAGIELIPAFWLCLRRGDPNRSNSATRCSLNNNQCEVKPVRSKLPFHATGVRLDVE
jgi:hypothetical protein